MITENEAYIKHLREQLEDLRSAKCRFEEQQDQICELEQNYQILKQEKMENEAQLEESIKTHGRILEGIRSENVFMLKNLMDKQILNENSYQLLNCKQQEVQNVIEEIANMNSRIESLEKLNRQTEEKTLAAKMKINTLTDEKEQQIHQIIELKENLKSIHEQINQSKINTIEREKEVLLIEKKKEDLNQILDEKKQEVKNLQNKLENEKEEVRCAKEVIELKTKQIKEIKQQIISTSNESKEFAEKFVEETYENKELEG